MTDYDPSAIHPQQQEELNSYKVNLMRQNTTYICKHPEAKAIYNWAGSYFWKAKPWGVLRKIGVRYKLPHNQFQQEMKKLMNDDAFHIAEELDESDGEEWDY
ncbi:UNVERIFIED_CONTAM: hypothetical protein PYX00_002514 [Menopon gallinae]|uniref:Uncharacterized protein n=1 Tax=Menopon gallinae TaxID=328185 RepID=A0AAW2IHM1_9NEOP